MDKEERMDEELQREAGTARPEEGDSLFDPMGNPIETEPPVPVEDEMEEEFPKEPPLLEVSYVLTEEELAQAFQAGGMYKVKGKRQWIYSFFMLVVIAITIYNIILDQSYLTMGCILTAICVALLAMVWLVPNLGLKKQAKRAYDPEPKVVRFYKGRIESGKEGNRHFGNIRLGGKNKVDLYGKLYVVQMENHRLIAIPERAIPVEEREKAKALLFGWEYDADEAGRS